MNPVTPTPEQVQAIADAINFALSFGAFLIAFFYLTNPQEEGGLPRWRRWWDWFAARYLADRPIMSHPVGASDRTQPHENPAESTATTIPQDGNNSIAVSETERNALLFAGKAEALAAIVHAGKIGETEGIKIVFGVGPSSTNKTYQAAREMLKARLARLQSPGRTLTPEQRAARKELGLEA